MTGMIKSYIALLCVLLLLTPAGGFAADPPQSNGPAPGSQRPLKEENGIFDRLTGPYRAAVQPENNLNNSTRIESLLRAGNLYLSLQDAIALALENNLDIAIQRYAPMLADTSVEIAQAGGFARGVSTNVTAGPNSASGSSSLLRAAASSSANGNPSNRRQISTTLDAFISVRWKPD